MARKSARLVAEERSRALRDAAIWQREHEDYMEMWFCVLSDHTARGELESCRVFTGASHGSTWEE